MTYGRGDVYGDKAEMWLTYWTCL